MVKGYITNFPCFQDDISVNSRGNPRARLESTIAAGGPRCACCTIDPYFFLSESTR